MGFTFDRPLVITDSSLFINKIEDYFAEYKVFATKKISELFQDSKDIRFYVDAIDLNIQEISNCLIDYRNGHKLSCGERFQNLMSKNSRYLRNHIHRDDAMMESNNSFYRIRKGLVYDHEKNQSPDYSLFHLPFKLREKVSTGRFNSAGIPILYLSDCLKIPYLECDKPKTKFCDNYSEKESINIGYFKNAKSFKYFDFSYIPWDKLLEEHKKKSTKSPIIDYLVLFPIITAIHVKISFSKEVNFHFDYVFSALFMDWLKNLELKNQLRTIGLFLPVYAVKYSSVRLFLIHKALPAPPEECYNNHNYAFLTRYYEGTSHCKQLQSIFLNNGVNQSIYFDDPILLKYKNKELSDSDFENLQNILST